MVGFLGKISLWSDLLCLHAASASTEEILQGTSVSTSDILSFVPRASSMLLVMLIFVLPILMPHLGRCLEDRLYVACTRLLLRSKVFSGITAFIGEPPRIVVRVALIPMISRQGLALDFLALDSWNSLQQ